MELTEVDPEVAAIAFAADLARTWSSGRPQERGWTRTKIDDLTEIVQMPGRAPDGGRRSLLLAAQRNALRPAPGEGELRRVPHLDDRP